MKRIYALLIIGVMGLTMAFTTAHYAKKDAKEVKWYNWNDGYPLGDKKDKIIMVDIYTSWCGWCKRLDHDTYGNEEIIDMLSKDFITVKLNPEDNSSKYILDKQELTGSALVNALTNGGTSGYPTIVFIYPKKKQVFFQAGYQDPKAFKKTLEGVLAKR